jgi:hypothetical protein
MKKPKDNTQPETQATITTPAFTMTISEEARKLSPTEALCLAISHCSNVAAQKFNPHFKSNYFGLGDLLAEVKPVFATYGLTILQTPYTEDGRISVKTEVLHHTGHRFDFRELSVKSEGTNLQQLGSITTYLRRYAISTIAGISADTDLSDDDGNLASKPKHYSPSTQAHPKAQPSKPSQAWWESIGITTPTQVQAAEAILWKKGWLREGEQLDFLAEDKVQTLTGNPKMTQAFMEAVNNG